MILRRLFNILFLNRKYIFKYMIKYVCVFYSVLGYISLFVSFEQIFFEQIKLSTKLIYSICILLAISIAFIIIISIYVLLTKRVVLMKCNNSKKVYLQYGDIFNPNIMVNESEKRNIVIPVNRCFDTIVDDCLISKKTIHGHAFNNLYQTDIYNEKSLNEKLKSMLAKEPKVVLKPTDKPSGNRNRYNEGTMVCLKVNETTVYLLWALSSFDSKNVASTTISEYVNAIQKLIEGCSKYSEGYPVIIPIVGAGLSRTNKEQSVLLKYLIQSIELNKELINCDIYIVIKDELKSEMSIFTN